MTDPEDDPSVMVEPPEDSDLPTLFFTEVPEDKMVKNRVHLDLVADTAIEDEVERLEASAPPSATGPRRTGACGP